VLAKENMMMMGGFMGAMGGYMRAPKGGMGGMSGCIGAPMPGMSGILA
jgi:hypothetical protein